MKGMMVPADIVSTQGGRMMAKPAPATDTGATPADEPRKVLRILVVEDEAITAMHIEDIVRDLGHIVADTVESGPAAIAAASRLRPDAMLIDIRLAKGTDGIAAALVIRRSLDIPLVFMSAHTDPAIRKRANMAEPLGYLVKPFAVDQVTALLDHVSGEIG
jgi:two-component system, response regulator PdtaR